MILTSCDEFSRTHLASEGVELTPMEPPTIDPYEVSREAVGPEGQRQEHSTKDTYDSLKQFLHHDRKVLRYFAHSETPFTPLGKTYKKKYIICFFLSDNSLEVGSNPECLCSNPWNVPGARCARQLRVQGSRHLPKVPQKAASSKNPVLHHPHCTIHIAPSTMWIPHCVIPHCTLHIAQCTMHIAHCALHIPGGKIHSLCVSMFQELQC